MTIERIGENISLTLEVSGLPELSKHPIRFKVILTPKRVSEIREMAEIVVKHKYPHPLSFWAIKAWDADGDWLHGVADTEEGQVTLDVSDPEFMECCAIVVSDHDFHYEALVKNCDIQCETEFVRISDLGK